MEKIKKPTQFRSSYLAVFLIGALFCTFLFLKIFGMHYETVQLTLQGEQFTARVADSAPKRAQGLSGLNQLGKNEAMLFVMPAPDIYPFWMKDMEFPLDILWLRNGKIIDIASRVPPPLPGTADEQLLQYTSRLPADSVIEVNAGTVDRLHIKIGDEVTVK